MGGLLVGWEGRGALVLEAVGFLLLVRGLGLATVGGLVLLVEHSQDLVLVDLVLGHTNLLQLLPSLTHPVLLIPIPYRYHGRIPIQELPKLVHRW